MHTAGLKDETLLNNMKANIHSVGNMQCLLAFMYGLCSSTHMVMMLTILRVFVTSKRSIFEKVDSLLPIALVITFFYVNFKYCDLAWNAPAVVQLSSGAYFCLCSTKLIISNVTKQRFSTFDDAALHLPFLFSLVMLPLHDAWSKDSTAEQRKMGEILLLALSLFANTFVYCIYVTNVIRQITSYLDIDCFSIRK